MLSCSFATQISQRKGKEIKTYLKCNEVIEWKTNQLICVAEKITKIKVMYVILTSLVI